MIEKYLFQISNAVNMNLFYASAAGLLVLLFLCWYIFYQLFGLGRQSRSLKRLCKKILNFEGVKGELIDTLNEVKKTKTIVTAWRAFLTAYATAKRVSIRDYFTVARILDVPSKKQSGSSFKWLNFVIGLGASLIGAVFIAEKNRLSLFDAAKSSLLNPIFLLFDLSLFLLLLYLIIESFSYSKALYRLERFCSLSELVFPREKRDNSEALSIKVDQLKIQLAEMSEKLSQITDRLDITKLVGGGQAAKAPQKEYIESESDDQKNEFEDL